MVHVPRISLPESLLARRKVSTMKRLEDDMFENELDSYGNVEAHSEKLMNQKRPSASLGSILRGGLLLQRQPKAEKKAQSISVSDVRSRERMGEIQADKSIVSLVIKDLIANKNCRSLASEMNDLFRLNDRKWQSIAFVDSIVPEDFSTWRGHKHAVMSVLSESFDLMSSMDQEQVEFRVTVEFPTGTSIKVLMHTLRSVNHHHLVRSVEFSGALSQSDKTKVRRRLQESVDCEGTLTEAIGLEVICGVDENPARFELLEMCLQKGRDIISRIAIDDSSPQGRCSRRGEDSEVTLRSPIRANRTRRCGRSIRLPRTVANRQGPTLEASPRSKTERSTRRPHKAPGRPGRSSAKSVTQLCFANDDVNELHSSLPNVFAASLDLTTGTGSDTAADPRKTERPRRRTHKAPGRQSAKYVTQLCFATNEDLDELHASMPNLLVASFDLTTDTDSDTPEWHNSAPNLGFSVL